MESANQSGKGSSEALQLLASERPRNVNWVQAGGLLFGDWGTSRLYVLGLAFLVAGHSSFFLIAAMSLLILAVGWAYTQICRIYPDGGGVYTAAKHRSQILGVVGALLLFADYTVTASLSALEAFHYFGLGQQHHAQVVREPIGDDIRLPEPASDGIHETLLSWDSPGLWAMIAILAIGAFNLMGPKHTAGYAIFAAVGMMAITLMLVVCALPQIDWSQLHLGRLLQPPLQLWEGFVFIVLALSGVEAIANLTGVMKRPVFGTAKKSIYMVAGEVALLNLLAALAMVAAATEIPSREAHSTDMLAFMAGYYIGGWAEWGVRVLGGLLLLSATNTAVTDMISVQYLMSRDGEMPRILQKLNGFGAPWIAAILAALVPCLVLVFAHDLQTLASLYAIGVIGAVAINVSLCAIHPRLRKKRRKIPMFLLGLLLVAIEITLAMTKQPALIFAGVVLATGLLLRQITRYLASRKPKPSLLRQAIMDQLPAEALAKPRILVSTAGSTAIAEPALRAADAAKAALVVCFVREVALSYKAEAETRLNLDTDPVAQQLFTDFLNQAQKHEVPIIPVYDAGPSPAELIAEHAAMNSAQQVLIGSSRRGKLHQIIRGSFQRKLESLLPREIPVRVIEPVHVESDTVTEQD